MSNMIKKINLDDSEEYENYGMIDIELSNGIIAPFIKIQSNSFGIDDYFSLDINDYINFKQPIKLDCLLKLISIDQNNDVLKFRIISAGHTPVEEYNNEALLALIDILSEYFLSMEYNLYEKIIDMNLKKSFAEILLHRVH